MEVVAGLLAVVFVVVLGFALIAFVYALASLIWGTLIYLGVNSLVAIGMLHVGHYSFFKSCVLGFVVTVVTTSLKSIFGSRNG